MSKIYYASSNGDIRGSDGELYHWQLKNHKYVKREKKNGKWVYTYPQEKGGNDKKTTASKPDIKTAIKTAANKAYVNSRGNSGVGTGPRTMSKEYEAELGYNSKKNEYPSPKMVSNQSSKVNAGKNAVTADKNTASAPKKASSEYEAEVAYNSKKNDYGFGEYKPLTGESLSGDAPYISKTVTSVTESPNKPDKNGFGEYKPITGESLSGDAPYISKTEKDRAKNVADFWKSFNKSKEFYTRGNPATPDSETKEKVVEQRANQKINAPEYKKYLEFRKQGAEAAKDWDDYKNDPANNYWQDIENGLPKKPKYREDRGLLGTLVDAAKDWWGDDERDYYRELQFEKYRRDRVYKEASDDAWKALDELTELENASKEGTKKVTQRELESAYNTFWNAAQWLDWNVDHKEAVDKAYEEAEAAYRKTKAFKIDQKVQSVEDFIEDVGDGMEDGRDWVEDRLDDLEDWWRKRR